MSKPTKLFRVEGTVGSQRLSKGSQSVSFSVLGQTLAEASTTVLEALEGLTEGTQEISIEYFQEIDRNG